MDYNHYNDLVADFENSGPDSKNYSLINHMFQSDYAQNLNLFQYKINSY